MRVCGEAEGLLSPSLINNEVAFTALLEKQSPVMLTVVKYALFIRCVISLLYYIVSDTTYVI